MKNFNWQNIHRILIIKLRHHGDVLLTSPVFNLLKQHCPSAEIDGLVYKETADMLSDLPSLSQLHLIDRKKGHKEPFNAKCKKEIALFNTLKERQYDLVIHLTESWRGAILCRLLKPEYSIVARYSRRSQKYWLSSFTHHYRVPPNRHTVEKHVDALRYIGVHPEKKSDLKLELSVNQEDRQYVKDMLNEHRAAQGKYILFHPTSRWLFKCWNEPSASAIIDKLILSGYQVVLTSGPDKKEKAMIERILGQCQQKPINFSGKTTLKQLGALIDYSALFLGVDSVPMHIAAAFQKPTVALFGPSDERVWSPWQTSSKILTSDDPCRPCQMDGCAGSKRSDCVYWIPVEQVYEAIQDFLLPQNTIQKIAAETIS